MPRPTTDLISWASDTNWSSGSRSGSALKDTAMSAGVAAQGIVAGQTLKAEQLNQALHNFYQWLEYQRSERGGGFFGDGSSGNATITGGTTTLASQQYYGDLTITSTGILVPSQWLVYVAGTLTIEAGGAIHADGGDAADGVTGAPPPDATAGAGAAGSTYLPNGGISGATGSYGAYGGNSDGDDASAGLNGSGYRSLGGAGGAGGASGGGATGGAGSPITGPIWPVRHAAFWLHQLREHLSAASAVPLYYGGGGGGEGGFSGVSGVKGAGGGGGGLCVIFARHVINAGRISANGGDGGNAFAVSATGIGGGGAGGAGAAVVICGEYSGAGTIEAAGGTGGAGTGTGAAGVDGADGLALQLII
jgi:hypothetical protein